MSNLTLVIPAKHEGDSLPVVLKELNNYEYHIIISVEENDIETINSIKGFDCEIVYQTKKGYGNAILDGIKNVKTEYFSIFNADGSFDPRDLSEMLELCEKNDFIFASRYKKDGGSDDDTIITLIGNFIFTKITNIFFKIKISDILYTYIVGKKSCVDELNLISDDFCLCVELPIKANRKKMLLKDISSYERKRIAGKKKVNEFKDGLKILIFIIKEFFMSSNTN